MFETERQTILIAAFILALFLGATGCTPNTETSSTAEAPSSITAATNPTGEAGATDEASSGTTSGTTMANGAETTDGKGTSSATSTQPAANPTPGATPSKINGKTRKTSSRDVIKSHESQFIRVSYMDRYFARSENNFK
jgi:hypothetical protein